MEIALLLGIFVVLLFVGFPIAFSLGISTMTYLILADIPLTILPQRFFAGMDSFVLLCIPGFILAGNLMNAGDITNKIIKFSDALFGHIRGGLGLANVGGSMIFGGISGTAIADTTSIGAVMIPGMAKRGYDKPFAAAVTASSSTVGPIIPPSVPMIIVGSLTSISVGKMFLAGAIPGLLLGLAMLATTYIISIVKNYPKGEKFSVKRLFLEGKSAIWALLLVVIILYGIIGGIFTPTEASIVASIYALFIGLFVYKTLSFKNIPAILLDTILGTAALMTLVGMANVFAWILASENIPQMLANGILSITENPVLVILFINILLLFVGSFMETIAALIILFPSLLKVAEGVGMDPVHFGVMAVLNLMIGLTTPPVGVCLFVASEIAETPLKKVIKALFPYLACNLIVLLLVAYIPQISLWLPSLFK
ncbi:TRAP transporter large permease [Lentisphaera marina]|uniref:TRAP transporter large permease n=1 Tax=Lentisphaera marina TaxID=1111041 RepID=UPI002365AAF3|nr:TRAP transporter large permease [Lentisphaera marina]MDD7984991.1 TRAP transporter large permease [Lentisphaera marina]